MTDIKFRFRVSVAPIPILSLAFWISFLVGVMLLYLQLSQNKGWEVPGFLTDFALIQTILGGLFFTVVFLWVAFAFWMRLSVFCSVNKKQFKQQINGAFLRSLNQELPIIANELGRSIRNIVKHAPLCSDVQKQGEKFWNKSTIQNCAYGLLHIMANGKFCQAVVSQSIWTAIALFSEMEIQKKYDLPVREFVRNVFTEALKNKDSILYHESSLGFHPDYKPFTLSLFGNFDLMEGLTIRGRCPLDIDYKFQCEWGDQEFEMYCNCLTTFSKAYIARIKEDGGYIHSYAYNIGLRTVTEVAERFRFEIKAEKYWDTPAYRLFSKSVDFAESTLSLFEDEAFQELPLTACKVKIAGNPIKSMDIYDWICQLIYDLMLTAAYIQEPFDNSWHVQQLIFDRLFIGFFNLKSSKAIRIIKHRLRRKIYDGIRQLLDPKMRNYQSARMLGFWLNVNGLNQRQPQKNDRRYEYFPLQKMILSCVKKNFWKLYCDNPELAESCLAGRITLDKINHKLVYSSRNTGSNPSSTFSFDLDARA